MSSFSGSIMSAITAESSICSPTETNLFASGQSIDASERVLPSNSDAHLTYEDEEVSEGEFRPNETQTNLQDSRSCTSNGEEGLVVYIKGNSKTEALKDCIYCQTILLALEEKQVPYKVELINTRKKPEWLYDVNPSGFLPLIKDGEVFVYESIRILDHLEQKYPQPAIPEDEEGMSAGGGIYGAFRRFLLNKDKSKDEALQRRLETELETLNTYLEKIEDEGCFFGGHSFNSADLALLPRLYRMKVALCYFKQYEIPHSYPKVKKYLEEASKQPSWKKTICDQEEIIISWRNHLCMTLRRGEQ
eukprot:g4338.t1